MTWLDIFVFVVIIISIIRGFRTGIVMQIASLAGIILGAMFAGKVAEWIYPYLQKLVEDPEGYIRPLSYIIGFLLILIAVNMIGRLVHSIAKVVFLGFVNRLGGAIFCLGKWILIISILLNLLVQFDMGRNIITEKNREKSKTYSPLIEIAQTIIPYLRFDKNIIPPKPESQSPPTISL